jgi:hypothetical protein
MKGGDRMCCTTGSHHGFQRWSQPNVCFCGCDDSMYLRPRFMTKEQRINRLKQHLEDLKNEAKAVEEHIVQIKKEK